MKKGILLTVLSAMASILTLQFFLTFAICSFV